jgi:transposase
LVTVLQFLEDLSDRPAAEAVRARIDWKYALGLELTDPGFPFSPLFSRVADRNRIVGRRGGQGVSFFRPAKDDHGLERVQKAI